MQDEKCTTALSDLIEVAERDAMAQMKRGERIRADKFTAGRYAKKLAEAFPDVKASHFRTARTNAKKIRDGERPYVTTPCYTLMAFISYLMTIEGGRDWPGVKDYVNNHLPEFRKILDSTVLPPDIDPVLSSVPIKDWETGDGDLGAQIVRFGQYVEQLEKVTKSKENEINRLMKLHDQEKSRAQEERKEYISLLCEVTNALKEFEEMKASGNNRQKKELSLLIDNLKQKIGIFKNI